MFLTNPDELRGHFEEGVVLCCQSCQYIEGNIFYWAGCSVYILRASVVCSLDSYQTDPVPVGIQLRPIPARGRNPGRQTQECFWFGMVYWGLAFQQQGFSSLRIWPHFLLIVMQVLRKMCYTTEMRWGIDSFRPNC